MEDALVPRTGRGGRRNASLLAEGSILAHDPDSPSELLTLVLRNMLVRTGISNEKFAYREETQGCRWSASEGRSHRSEVGLGSSPLSYYRDNLIRCQQGDKKRLHR